MLVDKERHYVVSLNMVFSRRVLLSPYNHLSLVYLTMPVHYTARNRLVAAIIMGVLRKLTVLKRHHHRHHDQGQHATEVAPSQAPVATNVAQPAPTVESVAPRATTPTDSTASNTTTEGSDETVTAGRSSAQTGVWTPAQDSLLVLMKARGNSNKAVRKVMPEKTLEEIEERLHHMSGLFDVIAAMHEDDDDEAEESEQETVEEASTSGKGKGKASGGGSAGGGISKGKEKASGGESAGEGSSKGKGKQKADEYQGSKEKIKPVAKNQKKVRIADPEVEEDPDFTDSSDDSFIDPEAEDLDWWPTGPEDAVYASRRHLKIVEVDSDEEDPIYIQGRPIVYMQPEDHLSKEDVSCKSTPYPTCLILLQMETLFMLTRKNDWYKWVEIASRFLVRRGKAIHPKILKIMLKNI